MLMYQIFGRQAQSALSTLSNTEKKAKKNVGLELQGTNLHGCEKNGTPENYGFHFFLNLVKIESGFWRGGGASEERNCFLVLSSAFLNTKCNLYFKDGLENFNEYAQYSCTHSDKVRFCI